MSARISLQSATKVELWVKNSSLSYCSHLWSYALPVAGTGVGGAIAWKCALDLESPRMFGTASKKKRDVIATRLQQR
eukprot:6467135-Amphidinium_carterae.1